MYSTYIGGNSNDVALSIALDEPDNAYITGLTYSSDYDTTVGAFQTTHAGGMDLFVSKIAIIPSLSVEEQHENVFFASPNPSKGMYEINLGSNIVDGFIEVYDLLGKLIQRYPFSLINTLSIDLSKEHAGIYLVKIKTDNRENILRVIKLDWKRDQQIIAWRLLANNGSGKICL